MALDHYIPQVYLKNFYTSDNRLNCMSKQKMQLFQAKTEAVCRIKNHSTNEYLIEPRLIEDFLKNIEPKLNIAIKDFENGSIGSESLYVVSGLISFISTCSPCAMRLAAKSLRRNVEEISKNEDRFGRIKPIVYDGIHHTLSELLENGSLKVSIDEKFPQAIGIRKILDTLYRIGNWTWEILMNNTPELFITSDYPIGIEVSSLNRPINKIFPLTPHIAIRLLPEKKVAGHKGRIGFNEFKYRIVELGRTDVSYINKILIQCDEQYVFFSEITNRIITKISKYSKYRVNLKDYMLPTERGYLLILTQVIEETQ